jgi:hypothetical protein
MTDDGVTIKDTPFAWAEICWVRYALVHQYVNGIYQETDLSLAVASPLGEATFVMKARMKGRLLPEPDEQYQRRVEVWNNAVDILEQRACHRLGADAVAAVRQGEPIEFAGVRIDRDGVHGLGLRKKTVRWSELAGTETMGDGRIRVLARRGTSAKPRITVPPHTWNAVMLPRVIEALTVGAN